MQTLLGDSGETATNEFATDYKSILDKLLQVNPVRYAKTRNFLHGAVTCLSPYISRGVISTKQVCEAVVKKGYKPWEMEKFLQELAWREYFQRVWQAKNELIWDDLKQPQPDTRHHRMVQAIEHGETGIISVDEQIKKLYATGYMHNHSRMYVASICCNIAKAHWLQPSRWMYYHLLDGDIASNNCSWQWVAGAFAGKKYYCNQENINKYTQGNQQHTYLDQSYEHLPAMEVPEILQVSSDLSLQTSLPLTELPEIDISLPTQIYNAYNLDPLWRKEEHNNRVLLLEPSHFARFPVSEKVIGFILDLAKNIPGIQIYCGEVSALESIYKGTKPGIGEAFISKEHPAFQYYPGLKDNRDWMFPRVTGYYSSFFSYWKKCSRYVDDHIQNRKPPLHHPRITS